MNQNVSKEAVILLGPPLREPLAKRLFDLVLASSVQQVVTEFVPRIHIMRAKDLCNSGEAWTDLIANPAKVRNLLFVGRDEFGRLWAWSVLSLHARKVLGPAPCAASL